MKSLRDTNRKDYQNEIEENFLEGNQKVLKYSYNRRGQLIYNNYTYVGNVKSGPSCVVYWRCTFHKKTKCTASIKTKGKNIFVAKGEHNHLPKPEKGCNARIWDEKLDM